MAVDFGERLARDAAARRLPILYVLHQEGVALEPAPGGRLRGLCPFHADETPSLDVWGENWEWWGCFPCGLTGGVIRLVQLLEGPSVGYEAAVEKANRLHTQMTQEGWKAEVGWTPKPRKPFAEVDAMRRVELGRDNVGAVERYCASRGWDQGFASYLRAFWRVGGEGERILIPHFGPGLGPGPGPLIGLKTRAVGEKPWAVPGSRFPHLYGVWRDGGEELVVLVEGESDAWVTQRRQGLAALVLGLPTGSGTPITDTMMEPLRGRRVYLAMDSDDAGRKAAARWRQALEGVASTVAKIELPAGMDCADADGRIFRYLSG